MTMTKMKMSLGGVKIESPFDKYVPAGACLHSLLATISRIDMLASLWTCEIPNSLNPFDLK